MANLFKLGPIEKSSSVLVKILTTWLYICVYLCLDVVHATVQACVLSDTPK